MNTTYLINVKPVEEFASYIRIRAQAITKNWWEVAEAFAEARDMYGSASASFKELAQITRFSPSSITKLISIVTSDRLKKYAVQLSSVGSWGTLYAISSLTDEQFDRLKKHYKLDESDTAAPFITQGDVNRFRKEPTTKSFFRGYAVIQIDDEAVKGGLLTGNELEEIHRLLERAETLSAYVAVKRTGNDEKEELSRLNRIEHKVEQIIRRVYLEAINARLAKYKKHPKERQDSYEARVLGKNRNEVMVDLKADPSEAFKYLGIEYDYAAFYKKAEKEVNSDELALMDKYAKKVMSRPPVVKDTVADEDRGWEDVNDMLTRNKEKELARVEAMREAFRDFK